MTPEQIAALPQILGIIGLLMGALYTLHKKWWVPGWVYAAQEADIKEVKEDRDFWRDTALTAIGNTDRAIEVASKRATDVAE